jgi:hypothetical protein
MAAYTLEIIQALRNTARDLGKSPDYQWGHMGSCNCGFLAQQITRKNKQFIHQSAMERSGDWNEQLNDYCPASGLKIDEVITEMLAFGFDAEDLKHLEKLSDARILGTLPDGHRFLVRNNKSDVITYLKAWACLIEDEMIKKITIDSFHPMANASEHNPSPVHPG